MKYQSKSIKHFREIMRAEMAPDIYHGPTCDQHRPRWLGSAEGDMDGPCEVGEPETGCVSLDPKHFPAGTIISVTVPCCPLCDTPADHETPVCDCGFDWREWANIQYF